MYHNFRHLLQRRCATITTTTTTTSTRSRAFSHYFSSQSSTNNFSDNPKNHQKNQNDNNQNHKKKKKWSTTTLVITTTLLTSLTAYYSHMIYRDCIRGMPNTYHVHPNSPLSPLVQQLSEKYIFRPSWYLNNTHLQTIVNAMMGDELDERRTRVERRVLRLDGEYHVYLDYISAKNTKSEKNDENTKSDENTKNIKMGEKKKNFVLIIPGVFAGTEGVSVKQFINHTLSLNNDDEENVCIVLNFTNNNNNQQNNQQKNFENNKNFENVQNEQSSQSSSSVRTVIPGLTHMDMSPELHSIIQHIYHNDVTPNNHNSKNSQNTNNDNTTNTTRNELFVMGISLGSNIMCNYLGMYPHESHQMISAAVALCNPFDLVATTRHLSSLYHMSPHNHQNFENQNFQENNFSHPKSENTKNGKSRFSRVMHSFYDRQLLIKRKEMLSQNLHYFVQYFNHVHHVIMTMNHQQQVQQQQQQQLQYENNLNNHSNNNNNNSSNGSGNNCVLHDVMSEWLNRIESTREFDSMFTIPLLHQHHSHTSHVHSNNSNNHDSEYEEHDNDDSDNDDNDVMMMGLDDYYASQSSAHVMDRIRVPLLCIHARDDHISLWNSALSAMRTMDNHHHNHNTHVNGHHTSNTSDMNMNMIYPNNEHVAFLVSEYGGHVGWLGNTTIVDKQSDKQKSDKSDRQNEKGDKRAPSWMQLVVMDYFDQMKQKSKQ